MTSSPLLDHAPHSHAGQHYSATPPSGNSPSLRAKPSGNITPLSLNQQYPQPQPQPQAHSQSQGQIHTQSQPQSQTRSYARPPPVRPYGSPMANRVRGGNADPQGDTKKFGDLVATMVEERTRMSRKGGNDQGQREDDAGGRLTKSVGGSLAGSWEKERAELIVDVPVWSPGCFQGTSVSLSTLLHPYRIPVLIRTDLSTLHALRDTTLAHTHSLLGYLQRSHSLASSYRLLARSTVGATRQPVGWGCIRLAPSNSSPIAPRKELKPLVRRSSTSLHSNPTRRSSVPVSPTSPIREKTQDEAASRGRRAPPAPEHAIVDEDEEDEEVEVKLKDGYISGTGSDVEEEETADEIIMKELDRRGAKEG